MRFRYKGTIIDTPNIDKKLKRMKLTIDQVEILPDIQKEQKVEDNTPQWLLDGYIKHTWVNEDSESNEYKYSIIGFHKENEEIRFPNHSGWNRDKCKLIENIHG